MPSSATVTAFTTFISGTKARAEQVNANYDNFRGHIIPIDPTTVSGVSDFSYGLGGADYRWGPSYIEKIFFGRTTTTWSVDDQTATGGDLVFRQNALRQITFNSTDGIRHGGNNGRTAFVDPGTNTVQLGGTASTFPVPEFDISFTASGLKDIYIGFTNIASLAGASLTGAELDARNTLTSFVIQYRLNTITASPVISQSWQLQGQQGSFGIAASSFGGIIRNLTAGAYTFKCTYFSGTNNTVTARSVAAYAYEL